MKKRTEQMLKQYYDAPEPECKQAFFDKTTIVNIKVKMWHMFAVQLQYIPKYVWLGSLALFAAMLLIEVYFPKSGAGEIYALVPFLVVLTLASGMRSCRFGMAELESAALFSLKSIVLMRLFILGTGNLLLMCVLAVLMRGRFLEEFLYLLVPYLFTAWIGLFICRHVNWAKANYLFFAVALFTASAQFFAGRQHPVLYSGDIPGVWIAASLFLLLALGIQMQKTIQKMEDAVWN